LKKEIKIFSGELGTWCIPDMDDADSPDGYAKYLNTKIYDRDGLVEVKNMIENPRVCGAPGVSKVFFILFSLVVRRTA
jgi:hypothetical protein